MVIFQHLDTQILKGNIILFGRTEHGKSVAVKIKDYKPHAVIRVEGDIEALKSRIQSSVLLHTASSWQSKDEEPMAVKKGNATFLWDIVDGQDITDYKEDGCYKFLKIRVPMKYCRLHTCGGKCTAAHFFLTGDVEILHSPRVRAARCAVSSVLAAKNNQN